MKTKVIYITGQAYSGSTFLCALLGVHSDMEPVSELSKWTIETLRKPDRLCACGRKVRECDFWSEVKTQWSNNNEPDLIQKYVGLQDRFEHISSVWVNNLAGIPRPAASFNEYQELTTALFRAVANVSRRSIIIDSSKLPARAIALSKMGDLDVSCIHLVRGGLHYLASSLKREKIKPKTSFYQLYNCFRWELSWSITNLSSAYALRKSNAKGLTVRYEDLISQPIQTIGDIENAFQIDLWEIKEHVTKNKPILYRHIATGSAHRYSGSTSIMKMYNEVPEIDPNLKLAFRLGAGLVSKKFGYL